MSVRCNDRRASSDPEPLVCAHQEAERIDVEEHSITWCAGCGAIHQCGLGGEWRWRFPRLTDPKAQP